MDKPKKIIEQLFSEAGIHINDPDKWDIQVRDERFYTRLVKDGSLGLGESYMAGWWDCSLIDALICRLLKGNLEEKIRGNPGHYCFTLPPVSSISSHLAGQISSLGGTTTSGTTFSFLF